MTVNQKEGRAKRQNPSLLGEVLERRLLLYALAAGATLAYASAAHAKVVFTPSDSVLRLPGSLQIDMTNDGTIDFKLHAFCGSPTSCSLGYSMSAKGYGSNAVGGSDDWAAALLPGAKIGPTVNFERRGLMMSCGIFSGCSGPFLNTRLRSLGVRFLISGEVHYGWIGFRSIDGHNFTAKLLGYAYETEPNTSILAFQPGYFAQSRRGTQPNNAILASLKEPLEALEPQPTSLELLAAGHVAIADRRRLAV
jgi:hypothetical protein